MPESSQVRLGFAGWETSASRDRDLFQLVDDARAVTVLYPAKGIGAAQRMDDAALLEKYGVPGSSYADLAALRGDASDGLPGVKGIGEKTATDGARVARRPLGPGHFADPGTGGAGRPLEPTCRQATTSAGRLWAPFRDGTA